MAGPIHTLVSVPVDQDFTNLILVNNKYREISTLVQNGDYLLTRGWFCSDTDHSKERRARVRNIHFWGYGNLIDATSGDFDKMLSGIETEKMGYDQDQYQDNRPINLAFLDAKSIVSMLDDSMNYLLEMDWFTSDRPDSWQRRMRVLNIIGNGFGDKISYSSNFDSILMDIEIRYLNARSIGYRNWVPKSRN